jgi:hypothetical protein
MSAVDRGLHLTLQESLARDLIVERVARRHRASRRRPSRAAMILRSLADRLDHSERVDCAPSANSMVTPPRPWSATARRAPHRHS